MSRIGKLPITIPTGVNVSIEADNVVITGSKGTLRQTLLANISLKSEENTLSVIRATEDQSVRAQHGLMRALINNMVIGVSQGYNIKLEINGVGYRAVQQGSDLRLNLGFSHDVIYHVPEGINTSIEQNIITVSGIDKQKVGQVAAEIRDLKKPEPYKGKGIKYVDERIIRKSGKTGKEK